MGDAFLAAFSVGQRLAFGRRAARNPRSLGRHMLDHGLVGIAFGGLGIVAGSFLGAGAGVAWSLVAGHSAQQKAATAWTSRAAASATAAVAMALRGAHLGALLGALVGLGITHGIAMASLYLGVAGCMAFALTGLFLGAAERGVETLLDLGGQLAQAAWTTAFSGRRSVPTLGSPLFQ